MFGIGDFAGNGRISVRMLRHYDAIGLLRPARVDRATGYRHYQADQLDRILALKDLGFTLQQVQTILDEQVTVDCDRPGGPGPGPAVAWYEDAPDGDGAVVVQTLARWIEANGYRSAGYARELCIESPPGEPDRWVTELQEPVTPARP